MFGANGYGTTQYGATGGGRITVLVTLTLQRAISGYVTTTITLQRGINGFVQSTLTLQRNIQNFVSTTLTLIRKIRIWENIAKPSTIWTDVSTTVTPTWSDRAKPSTTWTDIDKPEA